VFTSMMTRVRQDLETLISGRSGFLLEAKPHALTLHYRLAGKEDGERMVAQVVATVRGYQCRGVPLEAFRGKRGVEVRLVGVNKGEVVQALLRDRENTVLPLYLGDDPTDEDAFRALNGHGLSILVADPPRRTAARYYLKDSAEVLSFLSFVLRLRQNLTPLI
jgi:trehalose-phosphatase